VLLLGLRCVPFSYLAISAALGGLGQEFEDAARVHGASRWQALRLIAPILAPAIMSALAIGFAESISDFGVAATLAYNSNFTLATYALYAAIGNFPPSFPLAAGMSWLLVLAVSVPLFLQARALRGRSYAILSGRTRQAVRRRLSRLEGRDRHRGQPVQLPLRRRHGAGRARRVGPSGSGKTTLLRCLAGIERIDSGSLSIGSRVVADGRSHVPPEQRDLSMVFQDYALWPHLTALDNVAFALRRREHRNRCPAPMKKVRGHPPE
jgi:ABC transporter/Binding-protein-dependent transport system inner membrane component